jgi:hypothetical protein
VTLIAADVGTKGALVVRIPNSRVLRFFVEERMKRRWVTFFIGLAVVFLSCDAAWAQGSAQISGAVRDQSGAVMPGVEITATQTATGVARTTITNETGSYILPNLPTGPYRLEAVLPGFRTYAQSGIVLEINSNPTIPIVLEVGQVAETVEVQANAALVETRTTGVGQIMEVERILELPLNGRNAAELILGIGAAVQQGTSSPRSMPNQPDVRVAGGQAGSVAFSLDGSPHNNPYDNLNLPLPFPDALQEFKVETSALSASQGQHSGAQVNAMTRSGTNEFHGSLFEFLRNDLFNARQYFAIKNSTLKRNQFGGTIGGPVVRNKLFFFGGYQGTIIRSDPANRESWVPTAAALAGDFTALASPACNAGRAFNLTAPFVNNQVNPALYSPAALNLAARLPKPIDECGLVKWGIIDRDNERQIVAKSDWQINPSHSFVGRMLLTGNKRTPPYELSPENLLTVCCLGWDNLAESYTIGDTWLVSPVTVVSGRMTVNYTDVHRLGASFFNAADLGVKNHFSYQPKYSIININAPGFGLGGGTQSDSTFRTFSSGLNADVSMSRGNHQFSYGGVALWVDSNSNAHVNSPGVFTFSNSRIGLPMAAFLLGLPATVSQAAPNVDYMRDWYMAAYVADTWKLNPRWTVNYGVRWEPDIPEVLTLGQVGNYSEERRIARIRSTVFQRAPLGFHFPGDPGFPGNRGRNINWWTFAPRVGFAWDVNGDGLTSVRASSGIAYDYPNSQFHLWTSISQPWGAAVTLLNPSFDDPWSSQPGGNPFPAQYGVNTPFTSYGGWTTIPYDLQPAQVQSWNLSVQRQMGADWLVSASYLGSHTIHMLGAEPINPAIYVPGVANAAGECFLNGQAVNYRVAAGAACSNTGSGAGGTNSRRRLSLIDLQETGQYVASVSDITSAGNASYHGMLLNARKRAAQGVTLNVNYTWSHCIAPFQDSANGGTGLSPTDQNIFPDDRDRGRGNCSSDRRHALATSAVAETPQFANRTMRIIGSGWRLAAIYSRQSGAYLHITAGNNLDQARNGTNVNNQPAQYLGGDPYGETSGRPRTNWFNTAAFGTPAVGTFGNLGTRTVRGPGQWQFDVALSRIFQIRESQRIEARMEAFNVPNSFRPQNPNTQQNSSQFGSLIDARDPRILQFALKYVF